MSSDNVSKEIKTSKYSVYELWVAGENHPFYVGKGVSGRPYRHLSTARSGGTGYKSNKIRKAWRMSLPIIIKYVLRTDIEQEAFNEEKRLIEFYGRRDNDTGILINYTDGGEGASGVVCSEETRIKISNARKGKPLSEEHCQKLSAVHKGKPLSEEHCQNISKSLTGRKLSEEHIQNLGEANRGKVRSEEIRQKISKFLTGKKLSEETRQKLSKVLTGKKKPPRSKEHCQNLSNAKKGKKLSKEHTQKINESKKRYYAIQRQTQKNLTSLNELLSLNGGI